MSLAEITHRIQAALASRYTVERELGRGGMAFVYLAQDLKQHRLVAIKVLRPDLAAAIGTDRFLREIETAANLNHPHILPLHDSGEADGLLYYVMPYVEGESLRDRLRRERQLPLEEALQVAREVADALSYAHSHDVVHRDIKPENILFQAGHAVVADFGIARAITVAGGDRLTETGVALGTPIYMSPEQAAGDRELDGRADLYALGCVLYEMLAGQPPFTGPTAESILHQHIVAEPPLVTGIRGAVPAAVASAIRRVLAKTPADRFATAAQFANALRLSVGVPVVAAPARRWRLAVGVGVLASALVLGAVVVVRSGSRIAPAASVMAVLPFTPSAPDTLLTRLGRDLVVTLSANLDGVGGIRSVDALTILAQARDPNRVFTRAEAVELARRLGASGVVHGSLLRAGPTAVRLDLSLVSTDQPAEPVHASVTASPADLGAFTDSVTWALLRQVWSRGNPPTPSLAAITTRSVPALRAFLEGENAILENRWNAASRAFARAIAADSGFWLAYWRLEYVLGWHGRPVDSTVTAAVIAHRSALPERERLFMESADARQPAEAMQRLTERYPDYWPGWMQYGDFLTHNGPIIGYSQADAQAALERTVALNPRFAPAWEHLFWVTIDRDTVVAARALETLSRLGYAEATIADVGYDHSLVYRDRLRTARTGIVDRAGIEELARNVAKASDVGMWYAPFMLPGTQVIFSQAVLRTRPTANVAILHHRALPQAWAARGAWDSALVAIDLYQRQYPDDHEAALAPYQLAVVGVWLGALDAGAALKRRVLAARAASGIPLRSPWRAEFAWLDGLLAVARQDNAALANAREALRAAAIATTPLLERSLAAFEMELRGSRRAAARALTALEWERFEVPDGGYGYYDHPSLLGVNRLAASRWLLAEGDTAQALRLLMWNDAFFGGNRWQRAQAPFVALAYLARAQIAEAEGRRPQALDFYRQFLLRYDMPVPAHRHLVTSARAAVALLEK